MFLLLAMCLLTAAGCSNDTVPTDDRTPGSGGRGACPFEMEKPCEIADKLASLVAEGDLAAILSMASPTSFDCPGAPPPGLGGPFPLCAGANAGEQRLGYRIASHGSEGSVVSERGIPQMISLQFASEGTPISIGCVPDSRCESFLVAFSTGVLPQFVYFVFRSATGGGQPTIFAFGVGGDIADIVLNGGQAMTPLGETVFRRYITIR